VEPAGTRLGLLTLLALLAAPLWAACGGPGAPGSDTLTDEELEQARTRYSAEFVAVVDSANAAYRADDYAGALTLYERAVQMEPEAPVGWFGMYMAHRSLGNEDEAAEALATAREVAPRASLLNEDPPED
jgi:tetratricopeptide (TPR) repeat protein